MERLLVFFFLMLPSLGVATSISAACVSTITSLSFWKSNRNVSGLAAVAAPSSWSVFLCHHDQYPVMMNLLFLFVEICCRFPTCWFPAVVAALCLQRAALSLCEGHDVSHLTTGQMFVFKLK